MRLDDMARLLEIQEVVIGEAGGAIIGRYKICFYLESFVHESIALSFLRPLCISRFNPILLHDYWAIYDHPSTSFLYVIHHTI